MIIDDVIIAVRISTNDNDINNNYKIYMKGQAKGIQVERWKWSCKGVSSVTGRRAVLYKMATPNLKNLSSLPSFFSFILCFDFGQNYWTTPSHHIILTKYNS